MKDTKMGHLNKRTSVRVRVCGTLKKAEGLELQQILQSCRVQGLKLKHGAFVNVTMICMTKQHMLLSPCVSMEFQAPDQRR